MRLLILAPLFTLFFFATSFAQAPEKMNYQGVARDLSGSPLSDQQISLRISILEGSTSGTISYAETHNVTTNSLGLFSVQVGSGDPLSGSFSAINWAVSTHYLQLEIDETGGADYTLAGTNQLLSVPYALYAKNAGNTGFWSPYNGGISYSGGSVAIAEGLGSDFDPSRPLSIIGNTQVASERDFVFLDNQNNSNLSNVALTLTAGSPSMPDRPFTRLSHCSPNYTGVPDQAGKGVLSHQNGNGLIIRSNPELSTIKFKIGVDGNVPTEIASFQKSNYVFSTEGGIRSTSGDIYIEELGKGVIMKSPNGNCWRVTVSNSGGFISTQVTCP
ncbi:MAG: hypothetical protein ACE362_21700 [Phaeodactylibacter xiamenensis]|uniref:hypothetical protein n=1 Tax=Phaeodactylibacter xiamenensis TaxID=1524460 RepID=UPI001269A854|nr:hypothetical protein [Phaeodactylibacter xiamenensis]MCR9052888.1 hypothetical protein [bacterium]